MSDTTITIDGEKVTIADARPILGIPDGECFGCYLGDAGVDTHDRPNVCHIAEFVYYEERR